VVEIGAGLPLAERIARAAELLEQVAAAVAAGAERRRRQ
jgi:hypothetical protein